MIVINNKYEVDYKTHYNDCKGDYNLFYDLICDDQLEIDREYKKLKKQTKKTSVWSAFSIFKENLYGIIMVKQEYEKCDNNIWNRLKNMLNDEDKVDVKRAKEVGIDAVCESLNIELHRGRAVTPFVSDSSNKTAFVAINGTYKCFRTDKSGDTIDLVMEVTGMNFKESVNYINNTFLK